MSLTKTFVKEVLVVESGLVDINISAKNKPVNELYICLTLANLDYIYNFVNNILNKTEYTKLTELGLRE
jgi:hypothetical protein